VVSLWSVVPTLIIVGGFAFRSPPIVTPDTAEVLGGLVTTFYCLSDILSVHIGAAILTGIWGFYMDSIGHWLVASVWVVSVLLNIVGVTTGCQYEIVKYYLLVNSC
jgi:hypothetical protein